MGILSRSCEWMLDNSADALGDRVAGSVQQTKAPLVLYCSETEGSSRP